MGGPFKKLNQSPEPPGGAFVAAAGSEMPQPKKAAAEGRSGGGFPGTKPLTRVPTRSRPKNGGH